MATHVVLIGFMGAGKTAVGRILASQLGWRFVDSDTEVEKRLGMTIPNIFETLGESAFRDAERAAVQDALDECDVVISTGGGWAAEPGTLEALPDSAHVAWLQVTAEEAIRRLDDDAQRPLLARADRLTFARDLLSKRRSRYALAHHLYDTSSAGPDEIARRIHAVVRQQAQGSNSAEGSPREAPRKPEQHERKSTQP